MRLDKFLKVSRLIKRRTVAKEAAEKGRIKINGTIAKPGTNLKISDELDLRLGTKRITVRIECLDDIARKEDAQKMYSIISEKTVDREDEHFNKNDD